MCRDAKFLNFFKTNWNFKLPKFIQLVLKLWHFHLSPLENFRLFSYFSANQKVPNTSYQHFYRQRTSRKNFAYEKGLQVVPCLLSFSFLFGYLKSCLLENYCVCFRSKWECQFMFFSVSCLIFVVFSALR